MESVTPGTDLAKNIFVLHGVGADGKVALQRPAVKRVKRLEFIASLPPCLIDREALVVKGNRLPDCTARREAKSAAFGQTG